MGRTIAEHDYVLFVDCNHKDGVPLYRFFSEKKFQNLWYSKDVASLNLEDRSSLQPAVDKLAHDSDDPVTEQAFIDTVTTKVCKIFVSLADDLLETKLLAKIISGNASRGIKTNCTDSGAIGPEAEKLKAELETEWKKYRISRNLRIDEPVNNCHSKSLVSPDYQSLFADKAEVIEESIVRFRSSDEFNRPIIQNIENAGYKTGRKNLISYGWCHTIALQRAVAAIGKTSAVIALHACKDSFKENIAYLTLKQGRDRMDSYFHYIIAEDIFYNPSNQMFLPRYLRPQLTETAPR